MRIRPLRRYNLPDIADHVIHFTGRTGKRMRTVDEDIARQTDMQRLANILAQGEIRAFETFNSDEPVVCFTESVRASVSRLIGEGRYTACGIGFDKEFVFGQKGGPAFYVRGDEWPDLSGLPHPLRCRAVRFWPGADLEPGEVYLPGYLEGPSEWLHEREWRVPGDFVFGWGHIKFVITPSEDWLSVFADFLQTWIGDEYGQRLMTIPAVVVAPDGSVLRDDAGIWSA